MESNGKRVTLEGDQVAQALLDLDRRTFYEKEYPDVAKAYEERLRPAVEEVKRAFAGHESVEVMLDRRAGERRQGKGTAAPEKRKRDRRSRSVIDEQLRTIGWSLVLLDLAKAKRG